MNGNSVPSSGTMSNQLQPASRGPGGPSPWASVRGNRLGCDATAFPPLAGCLEGSCPVAARFTRVASAQDAGFVARAGQLGRDRLGVLVAACLEHELDAGLADVQVDPLAHVGYVDDVRAGLGDEREQPDQTARPVWH